MTFGIYNNSLLNNNLNIHINDQTIKRVVKCKYLQITINCNVGIISCRAGDQKNKMYVFQQNIFCISCKSEKYNDCPIVVNSILCDFSQYSCVWNYCVGRNIQKYPTISIKFTE